MITESFEWDEKKNLENQLKHDVSFEEAQLAFSDPNRLILSDKKHSTRKEKRLFCIGSVKGGVLTVRFTYRGDKVRIFGAGFWREYRKIYLMRK
jgi:uncharacterized DUF497 family protein